MAIWEKLFSKITFKDYPDTSTPLNADNLNKMTDAIDGIDDRVVELNSNLEIYNEKYLVGFKPVTDTISNDLNNLAVGQTISYNNATAVNMANAPNNKAARVYCILGFSNNPVQIALSYNTHSIWIRYYNDGVWSDWKDYSVCSIRNAYYTRLTDIENVDTEWTAPKNGILRVTSRPNVAGATVAIKAIDSFANHFIYAHAFLGATDYSEIADVHVFEGQKVLISSKDLYSLSVSFIDFV